MLKETIMPDRPFDLTLDPSMAYRIVELAQEFESEDMTAAFGSNDDIPDVDLRDPMTDQEDQAPRPMNDVSIDPIETELSALIDGLNIDAQRDLLALIWVGRGDYGPKDWHLARRQARDTRHMHVAQYLENTPLASHYLVEGLTQLGYPQSDYAEN